MSTRTQATVSVYVGFETPPSSVKVFHDRFLQLKCIYFLLLCMICVFVTFMVNGFSDITRMTEKMMITYYSMMDRLKSKKYKNYHPFGSHTCFVQNNCELFLSDIPYFMNDSIIITSLISVDDYDLIGDGDHTNSERNGNIMRMLQQLDEISCIFNNSLFFIYFYNSGSNVMVNTDSKIYKILMKWKTFTNDHLLHTKYCEKWKWRKKNNKQQSSIVFNHNLFNMSVNRDLLHMMMDNNNNMSDPSFTTDHSSQISHHSPSLVIKRMTNIHQQMYPPLFNTQSFYDHSKSKSEEINSIPNRIEYRNHMMSDIRLQMRQLISRSILNINSFHYFMIVDMNVIEMDTVLIMNELFVVNHSLSSPFILCSNSILRPGLMYDIENAVFMNDSWMYPLFNGLKRESLHCNHSPFPNKRFEGMHSCFGGNAIYSHVNQLLFNLSENYCSYVDHQCPTILSEETLPYLRYFNASQFCLYLESKPTYEPIMANIEHISFNLCLSYYASFRAMIAKYGSTWYFSIAEMEEQIVGQCKAKSISKQENCNQYFRTLSKSSPNVLRTIQGHIRDSERIAQGMLIG